MKRSKRLRPILELARNKSMQGLQAVTYMQNRLESEEELLQQLLNAKEEYKNTGQNGPKQTFNAHTLQSMRRFIGGVATAIGQQENQIKLVEGQVELVRAKWRELDARSKGLEKALTKLQDEEYRELDKREQVELDELVMQTHNNLRYSANRLN